MKKILLFLLTGLFPLLTQAAELLFDVDFTRDSTVWNTAFPETTGSPDKIVKVTGLSIDYCLFSGTYGKFNPGTSVCAQPISNAVQPMYNNANQLVYRRWAFRIDRNDPGVNSSLELPQFGSVGKVTIYCKNGNAGNEASFLIQKKSGDTWETVRTIYVPPHYEQNLEYQVEEYLNIEGPVVLRIAEATRNIHVYQVKVHAYDPAEPKEKPFRVLIVPDTQSLANRPEWNPMYGALGIWITNQADSLLFVLHEGDITQTNKDDQWKMAAGSFTAFNGKKLPFAFVSGNHDLGSNSNSRVSTKMNTYMPYSRYIRNGHIGGVFEANKIDNAWHTFEKDGYKFLVLSLEFAPRNKVVEWAKTVVQEHPKHNVILLTHAYMSNGSARLSGPFDSYGISNDTGDDAINNGEDLWNKLVRLYPNSMFVFSGHVTGKGYGYRMDEGFYGNKIYQFMANYQGGVDDITNTNNCYVRIMELDPANHKMSLRTYSPYFNRYNNITGQKFDFNDIQFIKDDTPVKKMQADDKVQYSVEGNNLKVKNHSGKKVTVSVYNLQGVKIKQTSGFEIKDLSIPNQGCYLVSIDGPNTPVRGKILIP